MRVDAADGSTTAREIAMRKLPVTGAASAYAPGGFMSSGATSLTCWAKHQW